MAAINTKATELSKYSLLSFLWQYVNADTLTMNFNEVADLSGFGDYSNFVRVFKNVCGITPTEYRRNNAGKA